MKSNLEWYDGWREVPANAQRKIQGGNLSGKTDINPMWRIKALTERFGPCGIGWYTEMVEHWVETFGDEACEWVRIKLYVKDPKTGEWSRPIEGVGGNKIYGKGKGSGINDECVKMSETDAISVCAKKLGIGADVYWAADATKYTPNPAASPARPAAKPDISEAIACMERSVDRKDLVANYHKYKDLFDGDAEFDAAVRRISVRFPRTAQ